jgi:signal transduction histidine kinase
MYKVKGENELIADAFPDSFYKKIVASGPAMLVVEANSLAIVLSNEQFTKDTGYSADEVKADHITLLDVISEEEHERLRAQLIECSGYQEGGGRFNIYKLALPHASKDLFQAYISPIYNENISSIEYYRVVMLFGYSQWKFPFISSDSRQLFFEQAGSIGYGTFEWLIDVNKVFWSDSLYNIYEIDDHEAPVDHAFVQTHTHPDDSERTSAVLRQALEDGQDFSIEYRIITAKQNVKIVSGQGRIIKNEKNEPVKLVGCVRDITEKRLTEQNLQKHVKELNRSNLELEEFAYMASHDLQEPLRKIMTFSDRLSEKYKDNLSGDGIMYLERMAASAENMRLLINNLLEFSRVAKSDAPFSEINLNFVLKEVKNDLELLIEETNASINSNPLPILEGSLIQMKQLFMNIINNAIKFRKPKQNPIINITSEELTKKEKLSYNLDIKKDYYKISISDNGIGFDKEYSERIFQIFQRLHGKSEYPGTGIGLATCKKIVEHHKGFMYAKGETGIGATFICILPETQ